MYLLYLLYLLLLTPIASYREVGSSSENDPFVPYESGFVGKENLASNFGRERVNEGSSRTQTLPRLFGGLDMGDNRANQVCPGMVGPMKDGKYYCISKEYGYCDRRSGTCFCSVGYEGYDCGSCSPSHIRAGGLCYPKKYCPSDCSGSGDCDYLTGTCSCRSHRTGSDCGTALCTGWSSLCTDCDSTKCLKCTEGYYVDDGNPAGYQCRTCTQFDPRCRICDKNECLECVDPLLSSIKRSGARPTDSALPQDELDRELSINVPFGSLQTNAFDEAETFNLQDTSDPDLNTLAVDCDQGYDTTTTWNCSATTISHRVCGHPGTFSFSSPEYDVLEDKDTIRITVRRSGGGAGMATVDYDIHHLETNGTFVTPTHVYTTTQTLSFATGEISKSFLVTVHDDRYYDNDRRFMLALRNPTGEASLGPQHRTIVTIKDDDKDRTTPFTSYIDSPGRDYTKFSINSVVLNGVEFEHNLAATESVAASWTRAFAGVDNVFNIAAMSGSGAARSTGGDVFLPEVVEKKYRAGYSRTSTDPDSKVPSYEFGSIVNNDQFRHGHRLTPIRPDKGSGGVVDNSDGSYTVTLNTKYAGNYELHVYQVVPGGFLGHYYDDPYFSPSSFAKRRVDASLNFNWDMGKVTTFGKDFVSAWWTGKVKVPSTNSYTFTLEFDDNVRMFLDGALLVDMWDRSPGIASAEHTLEANVYHDVMIEYRDVVGDAHLKLYWESAGAGVPYEIVPKDNMYYVEDISGSPYNYTVVAGDPDGPMSTARGKGLYKATAGLENKFVVEARDAFGNWRGDYNNGYGAEKAFHDYMLEDIAKLNGFVGSATLVTDNSGGGWGTTSVPVFIAFNSTTKLLDCTYMPGKSGIYNLHVGLSDEINYYTESVSALPQIFGSPFKVTNSPDKTSAQFSDVFDGFGNCVADQSNAALYDISGANSDTWGSWSSSDSCSGINHGLAGVEQTFNIKSRDHVNNERRTFDGDDNWEVWAHSQDSVLAWEGTVEQTGTAGTYLAKVTPKTSGRYYLDVTLDGVHAKGSPFELYVRHNEAYGPTSFVMDTTEAYLTGYTAPTANEYFVQPADLEGNNLRRTAYPYVPTVNVYVTSDAANSVTDATATITYPNDGSGRFKFAYNPTVVGPNKLNVVVNGQHIIGSPFDIVSEATVGSVKGDQSTASGLALTSGIAGVEGMFVVQGRDSLGQPRSSQGDTFTTQLVMQAVSTRPVDIDPTHTPVDTTAGSTSTFTGTQTYNGSGQYQIRYNATVSGTYNLNIQETGTGSNEHIAGSPFTLVIDPNVISATETTVPGSGTRDGTTGVANQIHIYARDVFDNYLITGGDKIRVKAETKTRHQSAWEKVVDATGYVVNGIVGADLASGNAEGTYSVDVPVSDDGDGTYVADFTPLKSGTYDLTVTVETPGGLWGNYYTSDDFMSSKLAVIKHDLVVDFDWGLYSPVAGGSHPAMYCVASTGLPDDPQTDFFDESKCYGNGLALPMDYFTAKWTGYIEAEHDEEYEFAVMCDVNSEASIQVAGVDVVPFGRCDGTIGAGKMKGKIVMSANTRVSFEVKYKHGELQSNIGVYWRSETQGSGSWTRVSKDRFYRDIIASNTVYTPTYIPNSPSSLMSTAVGSSVTQAVAGVVQTIVVECRDDFGVGGFGSLMLAGGGCNIAVVARGASSGVNGASFQGSITDNNDGTYTVTYNPVHSGAYYLSITAATYGDHADVGHHYGDLSITNYHVAGSPYVLKVDPGVVTTMSHIDRLLVEDAIVGVESNVTIWAKDTRDNRRLVGGDTFEIFLARAADGDTYGHVDGDKNVYGTVTDENDGTHTGRFTPGSQGGNLGTWKLHIVLKEYDASGNLVSRTEVTGSPYDITVWPSSPYGRETHVSSGENTKTLVVAAPGGEINTFSMGAGNSKTFFVQASDVSRNNWWIGGASLVARVRGNTNEPEVNTRLEVLDMQDGRYKVSLAMTVAGEYEIDVGIAGYSVGLEKYGKFVERDTGGFGLLGKYFTNQHLQGAPALVRVDRTVDFNWGHGLVVSGAIDYVSVEWTGYVKTPYSEEVIFELTNVDDYAKLYVDGKLLVDTSTEVFEGSFVGRANQLWEIKVEFFETDMAASVMLMWRSTSMERHKIPEKFLFSTLDAIQGSPFALTVT